MKLNLYFIYIACLSVIKNYISIGKAGIVSSGVCLMLALFINIGCKTTKQQKTEASSPKADSPEAEITKSGSSENDATIYNLPDEIEKHNLQESQSETGNKVEQIPSSATAEQQKDSLFASIKRTPCYGRCPTYSISIYKSGYVIYEGIRFVDRIGTYSTQISEKEIQKIIAKANETGYFDLNDVYDSPVTDLPTTITYLS
ncbi:MAG: DUF6438 domain-containing protein, partial [Bacteroidota bacterium]